MPKKSAMILLLVLGVICLVDGSIKKDIKEILVGLGSLIYAIVTLVNIRKKNQSDKNNREGNNPITPI
jgi:hypothetical protein